MGPSDIISCL